MCMSCLVLSCVEEVTKLPLSPPEVRKHCSCRLHSVVQKEGNQKNKKEKNRYKLFLGFLHVEDHASIYTDEKGNGKMATEEKRRDGNRWLGRKKMDGKSSPPLVINLAHFLTFLACCLCSLCPSISAVVWDYLFRIFCIFRFMHPVLNLKHFSSFPLRQPTPHRPPPSPTTQKQHNLPCDLPPRYSSNCVETSTSAFTSPSTVVLNV